MKKDAIFSPCRAYRYALWRIWDASLPYVLFIGLNPSTADEVIEDPTITRCINYSKSWDYGGVYVGNLFAFRAAKPKSLKTALDPIGSENDRWLQRLSRSAGIIVAAWGNHGGFKGRAEEVSCMLPEMYCLKINRSGYPAHPLYQKASATPIPYEAH